MLLFRAGTDLGYHICIVANEKFISMFVRAPTKSDALGLHIGKSSSGLENYHANDATASFLLFSLR